MMNAFDRDGISGWGAVVHIIEKDKVRIVYKKEDYNIDKEDILCYFLLNRCLR